jgi:hypothetical protein
MSEQGVVERGTIAVVDLLYMGSRGGYECNLIVGR